MADISSGNRRIAKNTLLLYFRMLFTMLINLYMSRIVLQTLGADDYGIYSVVGGVVVLFSFLTNAMSSSTQRFLNFNLGLQDSHEVSKVFNISILTHLTIFFVVLVLSETIGLWFLVSQMNIPEERTYAVMWVYQTSVLSALLGVMVIPYRASVIASEMMSVFAFVSIIEVLLKLIVVLLLPFFLVDNLILYSVLISVVSLIVFILYVIICYRKLPFTKIKWYWDKCQYREMMSFSTWYLFGGMAMVGSKQGTNILINIFFNVAVNAAVGIANQVRSAIYGFITSFQTAFNPQIVKLYATEDYPRMLGLIFRSSKFSYLLLFILSFPVFLYCDEILSIWLVEVPVYSSAFTRLVIISSLFEALSVPLSTAIGATGRIKYYQIYVSAVLLLNIPLIYFVLSLGASPVYAFIINLFVNMLAYLYRLMYIRKYVKYNYREYFFRVLYPCIKVTILSIPIPLLIKVYYQASIVATLAFIAVTVVTAAAFAMLFGLDEGERNYLKQITSKVSARFR